MKARVGTGAVLWLCASGFAQAAEPVGEHSASAAMLVTAGDDAEALTARANAALRGGYLFDTQIEIGGGLGVAAERDREDRTPIGGRLGDCSPATPGCPALGGAPLRGFSSGHFLSGVDDQDARISLESAYVYLRHGWGEVSVGRDQGASRRLSAAPPTVLAIGGGLEAPVDPAGGSIVLRNDIAGQSVKVTAVSTAILGVQAAVSYTPREEHEGVDRGFRRRAGAPAVFEPEQVWEGALGYAGVRGGWKTEASLTYARAEDRQGRGAFYRMDAWSAGLSLGRDGWTVGASYLDNDNGWAAGGARYRALGVSGTLEQGDWASMLEFGAARDDLLDVEQKTATAAVRRSFGRSFALAGGLNWSETDAPQGAVGASSGGDAALFLEASIDFE